MLLQHTDGSTSSLFSAEQHFWIFLFGLQQDLSGCIISGEVHT
jgi:hypothetical protein